MTKHKNAENLIILSCFNTKLWRGPERNENGDILTRKIDQTI